MLAISVVWLIPIVAFEAFPAGSVLFNGYSLGSIFVVWAVSNWVYENYVGVKRHRSDTIVQTRAAAREMQGDGHRSRSRKQRHPLVSAIRSAVPTLIVLVAVLLFVLVILFIYRAAQGTTAKMAVYFFGLAIKTGGNKLQLHVIHGIKGFPMWAADICVFAYEFVTALLCRLMLMSIPDEDTAILLSVLNCVTELMVRTWCYSDYIGSHVKTMQRKVNELNGIESIDDGRAHDNSVDYWQWGVLRVVDSTNDMVVEYVTSFAAAGMLLWLPRTGIFLLTADGSTVGQGANLLLLMRLVGYQVIPELVIDTFSSALEIRGGLSGQYTEYLGNVYRKKPVTLLMKLAMVAIVLPFTLAAAVVIK